MSPLDDVLVYRFGGSPYDYDGQLPANIGTPSNNEMGMAQNWKGQGYAGFSLCFHMPRCHVGTTVLNHSQIDFQEPQSKKKAGTQDHNLKPIQGSTFGLPQDGLNPGVLLWGQ